MHLLQRILCAVAIVSILGGCPNGFPETASGDDPHGADRPGGTPATVVRVADGDSLDVRFVDGRTATVRLAGIDCPEAAYPGRWPTQPGADNAEAFTRRRAEGREVVLVIHETDRFDRLIADVSVDGESLAHALVREGHAWQDRRYDNNPALTALEARARREGRGLWGGVSDGRAPVPPWEHRRARQP